MTAARKPCQKSNFPARPATSMGLSREPAGLRTPIQRGSTRNLFHQDSNQDLHLHSMHGQHQLEVCDKEKEQGWLRGACVIYLPLLLIGARTSARNFTHARLSQRSLSLGRVVTSSERVVDLATAVAIRVNAQRAWYDGRGTGHKTLQCLRCICSIPACPVFPNTLLTLTNYALLLHRIVLSVVEHDMRLVDVSPQSVSVIRCFRLQQRARVLTCLCHVAAQQVHRLVRAQL
jgi:hypothetical protein